MLHHGIGIIITLHEVNEVISGGSLSLWAWMYCCGNGLELLSACLVVSVCQDSSVFLSLKFPLSIISYLSKSILRPFFHVCDAMLELFAYVFTFLICSFLFRMPFPFHQNMTSYTLRTVSCKLRQSVYISWLYILSSAMGIVARFVVVLTLRLCRGRKLVEINNFSTVNGLRLLYNIFTVCWLANCFRAEKWAVSNYRAKPIDFQIIGQARQALPLRALPDFRGPPAMQARMYVLESVCSRSKVKFYTANVNTHCNAGFTALLNTSAVAFAFSHHCWISRVLCRTLMI